MMKTGFRTNEGCNCDGTVPPLVTRRHDKKAEGEHEKHHGRAWKGSCDMHALSEKMKQRPPDRHCEDWKARSPERSGSATLIVFNHPC
jgi:hypothetical protein